MSRALLLALFFSLTAAAARAQDQPAEPPAAPPASPPTAPPASPPAAAPAAAPAGQTTGDLVDTLAQEKQLLWQQAQRVFHDTEAKVRAAVLAHDFESARRLSQEATSVVERNRLNAGTSAEFDAFRTEARGLADYVETEARNHAETQAAIRQREAVELEARRLQQINEARAKKVALLKNQAEELFKERKYEESIQVLKQVIALEPTDSEAQWKKQHTEDFYNAWTQVGTRRIRGDQTIEAHHEVDESSVPWTKDILYPRNWRELSAIRKGASEEGEDPKTSEVRQKLTHDTVPDIKFEAQSFETVIEYLRDISGLNIIAKWQALSAAGIEKDAEVTLQLKGVTLQKVLDEVLAGVSSEVALGYDISDGVVTISTKEDLSNRRELHVYNVEDLLINVPKFRGGQPNLQQIGQNQGGGGGGGGGGFGQGGGQSGGGIFGGGGGSGQNEEEVTNEATVEALIQLVQQTIDPESWREAGGNIGSIRPLRNQLIVTQTSTAHQQLRDLLRQLRQAHAIQIAVEARFITITRNYLEQIGVDLDVVLNNGNAGFDRAGGGQQALRDPGTGALVLVPRQFSRNGFTPGVPTGLGVTLPQQAFPQPYGQAGLVPAPGDIAPHSGHFTPIPIQNNTLALATPVATNIPGSLAGNNNLPAFNLFGSFLDNIQVDFLLQATQADARSNDLDAPRLVLFNGQRAIFQSFITQDYVSQLIPVVGDNVGLFQPLINQALTGRQLDVEATVSADRRYVTMTIRTFTTVSGDPVPFNFQSGGRETSGFVQLVRRTLNNINTTVSVPDGGTLLIGGLKEAGERERDAGVPVLSRIPILKRAFSNTSLVKDDRVLLILIKPKIIIQEEAEEEAFPTITRTG